MPIFNPMLVGGGGGKTIAVKISNTTSNGVVTVYTYEAGVDPMAGQDVSAGGSISLTIPKCSPVLVVNKSNVFLPVLLAAYDGIVTSGSKTKHMFTTGTAGLLMCFESDAEFTIAH